MTQTRSPRPATAAMLWLFVLLLMLAGALPAAAQHEQHRHERAATQQDDTTRGMMEMMPGSMMQDEMMGMMHQHMQQMMQDPLRRAAMLVHVLPTLQEPLALSEAQVTQLKQHVKQFEEQKAAHEQQMKQAKAQLETLLASGDAAPDQVRHRLEEAAAHHARMQALAYETATQMKGVLSAEQRTKLAEMKPMHLHHHMMTSMTMMEMMQAMHGGQMHSMMQH